MLRMHRHSAPEMAEHLRNDPNLCHADKFLNAVDHVNEHGYTHPFNTEGHPLNGPKLRRMG